MRRVIWSELIRRRGRALALFAGILVAVTAFAVLSGTSASQRLEVRGAVGRSFRSAYDVLVRPRGARTAMERREGLVRPNYLSGLFGGITLRQWETIRRLPGIAVAAPIANVGYVMPSVTLPVDLSRAARRRGRTLLRVRLTWVTDAGLTRVPDSPLYAYVTDRRLTHESGGQSTGTTAEDYEHFSPHEQLANGRSAPICPDPNTFGVAADGPFDPLVRTTVDCFSRKTGLRGAGWWPNYHGDIQSPFWPAFRRGRVGVQLHWPFPFLLAAVDPEQEARLDGLNHAVTSGRYLTAGDQLRRLPVRRQAHGRVVSRQPVIPVLAASRSLVDDRAQLAVERLSRAAANGVVGVPLPSLPGENPLVRYLDHLPRGRTVMRVRVAPAVAYRKLIRGLRAPGHERYGLTVSRYWTVGPTRYTQRGALVPSPVPHRYGAYETGIGIGDAGEFAVPAEARDTWFRRLTAHEGDHNIGAAEQGQFQLPSLNTVGVFDPGRLPGFNPLSRLPLETYEPPALAGRTRSARVLLHGRRLAPNGNLAGYIAQPPLLLTTLKAASVFWGRYYADSAGVRPISAIRVRVAGVHGPDAVSRERIRAAAQRIVQATGLDVDLTVGSSPAPRAVDLPAGRYGRPELQLTEPWVKKNVATQVLSAVDRKSIVLFVLILVVCGLFVANAASAAVNTRQRELGVLACLGWSTPKLFGAVLGEVGLVGLAAGVLGSALALPLADAIGVNASPLRAALAVPAALLLALLAGSRPAIRAARMDPIAAVRPPVSETHRAFRPRSVGHLALLNLVRMPARAALGAASLAIGVCALTLLLAATVAFHNVLVGTLLGAAIAVQIHASDYVAVVVIIVLAAAAVGDVLFLNVRDRAVEFATLRALGWDEPSLGRLVGLEGLWMGLIGSACGGVLGLAGAAAFAGALPAELILTTLVAATAGTIIAALAAIAPAIGLRRLALVPLLAGE